jgi:uncharacterized protein (TIGR03435 family)
VRGLIESAYDVRDFQVLGGSSWLGTERFNVLARSGSDPSGARADDITATRLKLRTLLADRFALLVHRETRDIQEYALIIDAKGLKLAADPPVTSQNPRSGVNASCGHLTATSSSIGNLIVALSRQLRRPVIDRTGLDGRYSFELEWTPELVACPEANEGAPSIFTAVRERLGLRLDSITAPVEAIVIDRVQRPSED